MISPRVDTFIKKYGVAIVLLLMVLINMLITPNFVHINTLWNVTLVIVTSGIDLSVGATVALSAIIAAKLSVYGLVPAMLASLLAGFLVGSINGFIVNNFKIVPFIATLAVQMAVRGIAYLLTDMRSIAVDRSAETFIALGRGYWFGVPVPVLVFLVSGIGMIFVSQKTSFGRSVYAIGGNEDAARMMGLRVKRNKMLVYIITGLLSALAGVILCARLGAGQPVSGDGWEMDAIAAVAIGGTLLSGGVGGIGHTICGVLIIGFIKNIINLQGDINSYWQKIITGLILLLVIIAQNRSAKKRVG